MQVGNGVMNSETDFIGTFQYPWTHALISDQLYQQVIGSCTDSNFDAELCNNLENQVYSEMGNIDLYSIYAPICLDDSSELARVSANSRISLSVYIYLFHISNGAMFFPKIDYAYEYFVNSKKNRKFQDTILASVTTYTHILIRPMFRKHYMQT